MTNTLSACHNIYMIKPERRCYLFVFLWSTEPCLSYTWCQWLVFLRV